MPMITVETPNGTLTTAQKSALAEKLTHVLLMIEGGADTPASRSIAWVRFREFDGDDWFVGGTTDATYVSASGRFLIELNVPEGSMNQERKSEAHKAITASVLEALGLENTGGNARSVWIQLFEWPEGHLATSGRTSSLLGIAKIAGVPANHPLLDFPRAYFDAKDRMFDAHEFPDGTAGRALVRY
ncbi:MAG: tautomerase family protein [Sphingomonadaceae bacterium]|nr:tautomerase family protein [Sphingomonadaceae bacterium]